MRFAHGPTEARAKHTASAFGIREAAPIPRRLGQIHTARRGEQIHVLCMCVRIYIHIESHSAAGRTHTTSHPRELPWHMQNETHPEKCVLSKKNASLTAGLMETTTRTGEITCFSCSCAPMRLPAYKCATLS